VTTQFLLTIAGFGLLFGVVWIIVDWIDYFDRMKDK